MTGVAFVALLFILFLVDPKRASAAQIALFYATLFVLFSGAGSFLFIEVRKRFFHRQLSVARSLVLGVCTAGLAVMMAFLQDTRSMSFATAAAVFAAAALLVFLLRKKGYRFFL